VGEATAHRLIESLASLGVSLEDGSTVLDFGCGAGRTLRWLIQLFPEVRFHGTDTDGGAIAWCTAHLSGAEFRVNGVNPPTKYPDAFFDLAYAISVFTHLNLDHQKLWLAELHRILKPDGLLLFTVHGESALQSLPAGKRTELEREGFLFQTSPKLRGIVPDWYHTAFHTESGVRELLGETYRLLSYIPAAMGYHDVVIVANLRAEPSLQPETRFEPRE
jgi:cyclopropane fatty-acyl-phospholipid synthase-like methyltransferase